MGLFDGCFVTLLGSTLEIVIIGYFKLEHENQRNNLSGPIAFDLCGPRGASQAIGAIS